jgi:hypothetical protein
MSATDMWEVEQSTQNRRSIVAEAAIQIGAVLHALPRVTVTYIGQSFYLLGFSEIIQTKKIALLLKTYERPDVGFICDFYSRFLTAAKPGLSGIMVP